MLTNPRDAFRFLPVCNSNFVFKTRGFTDIRLQKCRDLEIRVRGHCMEVIECGTMRYWVYNFLLVFYCNFVPKTLRFDFENCRDLEIRVNGHSRSLKVVPLDRLGMISY